MHGGEEAVERSNNAEWILKVDDTRPMGNNSIFIQAPFWPAVVGPWV